MMIFFSLKLFHLYSHFFEFFKFFFLSQRLLIDIASQKIIYNFFCEIFCCKGISCSIDRLLKEHKSHIIYSVQWKRSIFCASIFIFWLKNLFNLLCAPFHAHSSTHDRIFIHKSIYGLFSRFISLCELIDKWTKENIFWIVCYLYPPRY